MAYAYILMLVFFTSTDGENFFMQSTTNIEVADKVACEAAASGMWKSFQKNKLVNLAAWCIPKDAKDAAAVERVPKVGR